MMVLFRLFSVQALKVFGLFVIGGLVGISIGKFFIDLPILLFLFCYLGLIGGVSLVFQLMAKDLNWILVLPISRKKILAVKYGLTLFSLFLLVVACVVVCAVSLALDGSLGSVMMRFAGPGNSSDADVFWTDSAVQICALGSVVFWVINLLCLSFFDRNASRTLFQQGTRPRFIVGAAIGFSFLLVAARPLAVLLMCPLFVMAVAQSTSIHLRLPHRLRNYLIFGSLLLFCLNAVFFYFVLLSGCESTSTKRQFASLEITWAIPTPIRNVLGLTIAKNKMAALIESELKPSQFDRVSRVYLDTYAQGQKIRKNQDPDLHFEALVKSRKTLLDLTHVVSLFDSSDFKLSDLNLIFDRLLALSKGEPVDALLFSLFSARRSPAELIDLLKSNNPFALQYAFFISRYDRDPALISVIESRLSEGAPLPTDELKTSALKSLSILVGTPMGLDALVDYRMGKRLPGTAKFFDLDCAQFKISKLEELSAAHAPQLNLCLRQRADRRNLKLLGAIESAAWMWMSPPLSPSQTAVVKEVFHLK